MTVETAREKSPVASNGSGDTPILLDDLIRIESDDDDGADIQLAPVPACPHRWRFRTRWGARVHGFTRAPQGVGSNRVRVRGGRRGYTGQGNARQRNGNGKADDWKWESVDIGGHVDLENFVFVENEGLQVRIKDNPQPVDFVEHYLTDNCWGNHKRNK